MSHKPGSSATEVRAWLDAAHRDLRRHTDVLDNLNVFPVADADTGANLTTTLGCAAQAGHLIEGRDVGELLLYAGQAALEEARGNSGMLAALTLTALGGAVEGSSRLTAEQLRDGFTAARVRCSSALTEPVPGTMISVLEAAGEVPVPETSADGSNQQLAQWLEDMVTATARAVVHTVSQLPVLTERGTVDSGALGMLIILTAMRRELGGEDSGVDPVAEIIRDHTHPRSATASAPQEGYEVMGTMDLSALDAAELRHELDDAGHSVIVSAVGEHEVGYTWRVHVHVADPETALELMRARGSARNVTVTTLTAEPR
nr:DAK2 domain-containing protein [Kocuria rhizophila]